MNHFNRRLQSFGLVLSLVAVATACDPNDPSYDDAIRSEYLSVVPSAAKPEYSVASADAFLDGAHVIRDASNFNLKVLNSAPAGDTRLVLKDGQPDVLVDVNSLETARLLVIVNDPAKITKLIVGGTTLTAASFTQGTPTLNDGEPAVSGARFPGFHAFVEIAGIRSGQFLETTVSVSATYEARIHFESVADSWGGRIFVTHSKAGTTYVTSPRVIPDYTLTVSKAGNGAGRVSTKAAGIDCGEHCQAIYSEDTAVTLSATPAAGSRFTGWSGDCAGSGSCTVTMSAAKAVTANFTLESYGLAVTKTGTGTGTVTSPAGISCGADCTIEANHGSAVTLTATASANSEFTGWSGACTGTANTCVVSVASAASVTANFDLKSYALTVKKEGDRTGTVVSLPGSINCGSECAAQLTHGTQITLYAAPDANVIFGGFSGPCVEVDGNPNACVVTMTAATEVVAYFTSELHKLTVDTNGGNAFGTVKSTPNGINCEFTKCSAEFAHGTLVTLTAAPGPYGDTTFVGWGGACASAGNSATCLIEMSQAKSVVAIFHCECFDVAVTLIGAGKGSVVSLPAGINCPEDECVRLAAFNTTGTLTATPDANSVFAGWTGACEAFGTNPVCTLTVTGPLESTARFEPKTEQE